MALEKYNWALILLLFLFVPLSLSFFSFLSFYYYLQIVILVMSMAALGVELTIEYTYIPTIYTEQEYACGRHFIYSLFCVYDCFSLIAVASGRVRFVFWYGRSRSFFILLFTFIIISKSLEWIVAIVTQNEKTESVTEYMKLEEEINSHVTLGSTNFVYSHNQNSVYKMKREWPKYSNATTNNNDKKARMPNANKCRRGPKKR